LEEEGGSAPAPILDIENEWTFEWFKLF
jgi:hypothetical protein